MEPVETKRISGTTVACDGSGPNDPAVGHPRVFLTLGDDGEVACPYCGRRFISDGAGPGAKGPGAKGPGAADQSAADASAADASAADQDSRAH